MRKSSVVLMLAPFLSAALSEAQTPVTADDYFNRAITREGKNDLDGAITDYTKAIALNPNYANHYINRGTSG